MKATSFSLALALLFTISGCTEDDDTNNPPTDGPYTYIDLTVDGTTIRYGSAVSGFINTTSEGEELLGSVSFYPTDGNLSIQANSNFYLDNTKSSGANFILVFDFDGSFGSLVLDESQFNVGYNQRETVGALNALTNGLTYDGNRETRMLDGSNCVSTAATAAPLTVNITQWTTGSGGVKEGTVEGTFYENIRSEANGCQNSVAHEFSIAFKVQS